MDFQAGITLAIVALCLIALIKNIAPSDWVFLAAISVLVLLGIISPDEAFAGFANSGTLTVAALYVVAAGLRDTGILDYVGQKAFGSVRDYSTALLRLAGITIPLSSFLNNTPIVAMLMPVVIDWSRRNNISPSKMLIPLSFLTVLGGTVTLIGTSTNLVVSGLMTKNDAFDRGIGLFELSLVGIPYAIAGAAFVYFFGPRLLPDRSELMEQLGESRREYLTEMRVEANCSLGGKTVEESSLRGLPGLFLIEIDRDGEVIAPVQPSQKIHHGDHLIFTGVVSTMVELEKIPGLVPVADPNYDVTPGSHNGRRLWEAVVSQSSPLVGQTLRESDFRATYSAAVLAMHRGGERIKDKLGGVEIQAGDTLLLLAARHFRRAFCNDPAFYLISDVSEWRPLRRDRARVAVAILLTLILTMATGWIDTAVVAVLAAVAMVVTRCINTGDARQSIDWPVLITMAASFGIGAALHNSGAAQSISSGLIPLITSCGPNLQNYVALAIVFLSVCLLTSVVTNNAAAALMFPFCLSLAQQLNCDPRPFMISLTLAASACFMTPIGYQTNMMIYGPGGYKFSDFFWIGAPLNLVLWIVSTLLIPVFWSF